MHELASENVHVCPRIFREQVNLEFCFSNSGVIFVPVMNLRTASRSIIRCIVLRCHFLVIAQLVSILIAECFEQIPAKLRVFLLCSLAVPEHISEIHRNGFIPEKAFVVSSFFKISSIMFNELVNLCGFVEVVFLVKHMPKFVCDCRKVAVYSRANGVRVRVVYALRVCTSDLSRVDLNTENAFRFLVQVGYRLHLWKFSVFSVA